MKSSRSKATPDDAPQEALQAALRFLAHRAHSETEISEYLKRKGFSSAGTAGALARLRALGYTDDGKFARHWARRRAEDSGHGPLRIARELRAKGVATELVAAAVKEAFSAIDEGETARRVLEKRFRNQNLGDVRTLRRAAAYLQRHGYSETVIANLLQRHRV